MAVPTPTRGPRRGTQGQGAVGPSPQWRQFPDWPATRARLRSWRRRNPLTEPMLMLVGPSQEGGGLCRPVNAPAQVSQQGRGVSDPAAASQMRPRRCPAGSLTPVCQCRICWGARLVRAGMLFENPHGRERQFSFRKEQPELLRFCAGSRKCCAQLSRSDRLLVCSRSGSRLSGSA